VDQYQLFVVPPAAGGGTRAVPGQVHLNLASTTVRSRKATQDCGTPPIAGPGPPPREDADQMPNDADRAGTPAGVFGAELRFYRTRAGLSQKDLAARANVSHDVISKIETGERPPAEDFPPRLDAVPELDTRFRGAQAVMSCLV
jgi:ribosome-binding protein aMBF1 (putative translation factor)